MKKTIAWILALVMALSMAACGSSSTPATTSAPASGSSDAPAAAGDTASDWTWDRDVEWICMYDVGSGTDATLRALSDAVGKELGVNIVINNVSGGSGLNGMEFFYGQPADGYTYGMLGISHVLAGLKGTASFDVENEMTAVACLVQDIEVIYANPDLPFSDWDGLVAYAKEHPGELTLGLTSINGVDALSVTQLFQEAGIDVTLVAVDSELYSMVIGGHVDMALGSPNECNDYVAAGQLIPMFVLNDVRSSALPDTPCSGDYDYNATIGPWRALFAKTGTPEAAIASMDAALQKVMNEDPSWAEWKEVNGLNDRQAQRDHVEMEEYWHQQFKDLSEVLATK